MSMVYDSSGLALKIKVQRLFPLDKFMGVFQACDKSTYLGVFVGVMV